MRRHPALVALSHDHHRAFVKAHGLRSAEADEGCLMAFLEELLNPGVKVEIDSCDPASGYAYEPWRQSCSDPAAGHLDRIEAAP